MQIEFKCVEPNIRHLDELFPMFGKIQHILVYENNVYFARTQVGETVLSDSRHFHAFVIQEKHSGA